MKKQFATFVFSFICLSFSVMAQSAFEKEFSSIKQELTNWDPIRGEWLANSIIALAEKKPVPDRTFPEEFTPYQMASMIPLEQRRLISQSITHGRNSNDTQNSNQWSIAELIFNHSFCSSLIGRSYGDPHLRSFDQATYSFQTVGEFVVAKSTKNEFEVQARQSPQNSNFSLNSAIALNVAGDRLCYYVREKPDGHFSPWRLNGQPLVLNGGTFYLPNGGTLSLNGRFYTVSWPTGENVIVESRSGQFGFVNLTVEVFECDRGEFEGLLGNGNGIMEDDFNGRSSNRQRPVYASFSSFGNPMLQQATVVAEREYLNFLARDFAEDWRVTDQTTLFDYASGSSTASFTDRTFPIEHFTVSDLPSDRREASRRRCQEMGVSNDEMPGCIFDNGFLDLTPSPVPVANNPTRDIHLIQLNKPIINNNSGIFNTESNPLPIAKPNTMETNKVPVGKESKENNIPTNTFEIKSPKYNPPPKNTEPIKTPSSNPPVKSPSIKAGGTTIKKG